MPDSPKCWQCLQSGIVAQTFRVAGSSIYRCRRCRQQYNHVDMDRAAFDWKEHPGRWRSWVSPQLSPEKMGLIEKAILQELLK